LLEPAEIEEEDRELGARLLAERSPEEIAAALVARTAPACPRPRRCSTAPDGGPQRQEGPRGGFEDSVWFRMDIGRRHNADPRWLLRCSAAAGHISRSDIGAIRIAPNETAFEISQAVAGRFVAAVKRTAGGDPDGEGGV
jgi:ATP-dependent RNA helicase DeaD